MMPLMHGDGIVNESQLLNALGWLHDRAATASPDQFVDVICLALGYYEEQPADATYTNKLRRVLGKLGDLGVRVVASAGNDATDQPTYPAAIAVNTIAPPVRLVSVGALNPNRTRAIYGNQAQWVTDWEVGTAVVSTLPAFNGSQNPTVTINEPGAEPREAVDPDDFSGGDANGRHFEGGFARWSGTSFAAAALAGRLAHALGVNAAAAGADSMIDVSPPAAIDRAAAAYSARHEGV